MTINGVSGTNAQAAQMGMNQTVDSYSRNIQNQIANAQKQLQELSSNEKMTLEEKMKKRQEIQQQINDLNMQLRQHQMEQRKEKQQAKGTSMNDMLGGSGSAAGKAENAGLSQAGMAAILSADTSIKQAKVQGSAASGLEGRARVLEGEIKNSHNADVTKKKEELAALTQKAQSAAASQMDTLAEARKTIEQAAQAEQTAEQAADGSTDREKAQSGVSGADGQTGNTEDVQPEQNGQPEQTAETETQTAQAAVYAHVDVRL